MSLALRLLVRPIVPALGVAGSPVTAIGAAIVISICQGVGADLTGYIRARQQYDPMSVTSCKPVFDWALFAARVGQGIAFGLLSGLVTSGLAVAAANSTSTQGGL